MPPRSSSLALALCLLLSGALPLSNASGATPSSPCASTCINSLDFIPPNPNLLRSQWKEIDCKILDYGYEVRGQKMRDCMSCLQESTFADGTDRDHNWFLFLASLNDRCQQSSSFNSFVHPKAVILARDANDATIPADASSSSKLPAAGVASIIAGAIILLALVILGALAQIRKRRTGHRFRHGRNKSSLSFRCQAGVIPPYRSGYYNEDYMYDDDRFFEKPNSSTGIAVTTPVAQDNQTTYGPNRNKSTQSRVPSAAMKPSIITTNLPPPSPTYTFSRRLNSPDDYMSPSSPPGPSYTPTSNNIGIAISPHSFASLNMSSPPSRDTSPIVYKPVWPSETIVQQQDLWQEERLVSPKRQYMNMNYKSRTRNNIGSPTQVTALQLSFPPPPKR